VADVLKVYDKTIEDDKVNRNLEVTQRAKALESRSSKQVEPRYTA